MTDSVLIHRFFKDNLSMAEALNYNYSQVAIFVLTSIFQSKLIHFHRSAIFSYKKYETTLRLLASSIVMLEFFWPVSCSS